jgi:hypothetical protein
VLKSDGGAVDRLRVFQQYGWRPRRLALLAELGRDRQVGGIVLIGLICLLFWR